MNKLMLILVEGKSDERSLGLALTRVLDNVKFYVINTDITSDYLSNETNVEGKIFERISFFLAEKPQFSYTDISHVVQIVDTDGVYIKDSSVIVDLSKRTAEYTNESILIDDVEKILPRNSRKSLILNKLCSNNCIRTIDKHGNELKLKYRVYYMSCNLEHVLHDKPNCSDNEKKELSNIFRRKTGENKDALRDILFTPGIDNSTSYSESWEYIKKNNNSLLRKSNFSYFYREFIDKEDF